MNEKIIEIIKSGLLTPVIYLLDDDVLSVVGFFDGSTQLNHMYEIQTKLERELGREINICDIRDFSEADRLDIVKNGDLIYSETPLIKSLFENAMIEDYTIAQSRKKDMLERSKKTGSLFLS